MRAASVAELLHVGGGRQERCASVLCSPGELEPFLLALSVTQCWRKGRDFEYLMHCVCYFLQFVLFDCLLKEFENKCLYFP